MDHKRAAAALLALAACIACTSAAPTASNQTALELMDGPSDGCYYNFQHYGEGDRIMTNEPCLNCTCHKRMLMCYLRVCPFTKAIGQDCTVEKRADQCCPIVTCPDVPVDLLTSTSTSSPAEYGTTGVGKFDKYGCSINGKYFSEGSKVPSTPNKPCEHCYCIRNMTTCVMQECTLHVDGCTPIYHKDVCCPVRYSCDHEEDETLLLDDMTTTVRPTPGFLLTTTTVMPVTQITQDCIHDYQVFPDGTLIKTEKACEHCYCMKGDIVCVVQECGTPMENEGKNCTSLPPRHGQCCPDTYICEGDDHVTELTTEIQQEKSTQPPRRVGVEGSGYRNEPDEPFTEKGTFETDIEGSGEDYATDSPAMTIEDVITEKIQPNIIDETFLSTTEKYQISHITEPDKDQNTIPDVISDTGSSNLPETIGQTTEANLELTSIDTDQHKTENELISKEDEYITTESLFKKDDNSIISDEMLTIKETEKLPTTMVDLVEETTFKDELLDNVSTEDISKPQEQSTTISDKSTPEVVSIVQEKEATTDNLSLSSSTESIKPVDEVLLTTEEQLFTGLTTMAEDKTELLETTSINPGINEIDEDISIVSSPGRIPGEGDCLLNGITYKNNTTVPTSNNCHTSCKCVSSIIKCDPIICSSPPEYVENMNDCQPIYDSPDACCPTYVCSAKETIPPESHNQMSGTESPKPISGSDCNGQDCILNEVQKEISKPPSSCTSEDCLDKSADKQDKGDCGLNGCGDETRKPSNQDCADDKCQILPAVACEGENCINEPVFSQDSHKKPDSDKEPSAICDENDCKTPDISLDSECKDESCKKQENTISEVNIPSDCTEPECKKHDMPISPPTEKITEQKINETAPSEDSHKIPNSDKRPSVICDDNNDCKIPESTETEVNVPLDCTEPECKKHDMPISSPTEETTEQKINEPAPSEVSHKIPDSDKGSPVICDDNNDCKTPQTTETEVNLPSDCTEPECKTHDMTLSTPTEEATEQNINEQGPSEDSHKIPDSDKGSPVICDDNNDCKTPQITETEVNLPSDCTEPECKTHDMTLSTPTEEATEQNINEQGPSEDSHKIPDSDNRPSAICDENDCKTPEISHDGECKDESCKKQESTKTEVNIPSDCTEPECKTQDIPLSPPTEEATEQNINEQGPSEDSHKIPESDKGPSAICDENNDCKTPEISQHDECKEESCKKQEGMETEVNVPTDCSESKCKTPLQPSEETTDSATENISNDIVQTDVTQSPIDTITEISEKTTKTAEIIPEVTKEVNIEPSEKLTTISDVFSDVTDAVADSELTESPIIQSTSQKYDIKITEHTIIEHVTESLAPQEADKVTLADETATDKEIAGPAKTEPQDQADKMDVTTEILEETTDSNVHSTKHDEKYGTVSQLDTEKEKTPTGIPELNQNEKLSTTEATGASEKLTTVKDVTEMYEIQKENTEVPITLDDVDTQTEKISTDYNKATETHNLPQGTIEPHDQFVETHTEKEKTETSELDETHDVITEKNTVDMAIDVTPESPVTEVITDVEVITDKLGVTIEPNNVPTELPQSSQTKLDQVTKDVTEIVTDKDEAYTESITPKVEDATLEPSVQSNGVPQEDKKSEVTEESITQKVTVTESSNILQTKTESTSGEFGQFVTKSEEIYAETPQQPIDKVDEISSTPILEKNVEEHVTEKSTTQIVVSESTEKQKIYDEFTTEHEQELHTTVYEEIINKDQTISIDSRTELPTSFTISTETMKVNKDQDVRTDEPDKSVTEKGLDSSDDSIHATSKADEVQPTEVYQQITEKLEVITESTPSHEFGDDNTRRQNTIQPTSSERPDSNEKDLESVKQTTIQDIIVMPEATTIIQDHVQVIESHTKSPSQDDEKHEEPSTEVEKESPFETDVTNMETVTELLTKKPDETYVTPPFDAISKGDGITENYATVSPNIDTEMIGESQSHLDSSTELSTHNHGESSESSLPHEEIEISDKVTTVIPHVKENADKQPAVLTESELTSHNLEKTTASLISVDEKETEPQLHITESYDHVQEEQTVKPTSGLMIGVHDYENTEKSVSDEENLPQQTNEYSPIDGITEEVSLQTLQDVSTEKTKIKDTLETLAPEYIGTTQSELSTKSEESSVTDSALFDKEKGTATELPHSYTTIEDLDKISDSVQKDTKDENINKLPESVENNQELTTPVYTKSDENQEIATPVSDVTDIKQIAEVELPENNKVGIESTTKLFDDTNAEVEGEQTVPDLHITESQTEKSKDEITQKQESSTDKITESPDYLSTSHLQEQQTTSSVDIKTPQQATVTEKQSDQTELVSEEQPTQPELHSTEDTLASTVKKGLINIEDEKATLVPDFEQVTSHSPEYQTTGLISDDKNTIELKSTTMSSETHHEIVTDVEKSPVSFDMVTTESVITKQSETERNEIDIVKYTQFDHISTGEPPSVTESNKYENNQEQSTEVPVSIVTHLSTEPIKVATEEQIVSVTESHAKGTETTESHYTTIAEEKESSTAPSNISDKEPEQSSKDDEKMITKEPEGIQEFTTKEDFQTQLGNKNVTTSVTKDIGINIETTKPTIIKKEETEQSEIYSTEHSIDMQTEKQVSQNELDKLTTESVQTLPPHVNIATELPVSTGKDEESYVTENNRQTTESHDKFSETTQFLVELEEHTHPVVDEITTKSSLEDIATTVLYETHEPQQPERGDQIPEDLSTHKDEYPTEHSKTTAATIEDKEQPVTQVQEQIDESTSVIPPKSETETSHITEKLPIQTSVYEPVETEKDSTKYDDNVISSPTPQIVKDTTLQDYSTESIEIHQTPSSTLSDVEISSEKDIHFSSEKPETFEEKLTPELPKETTSKVSEETATSSAKPQEKPVDTTLRPVIPDVPKPEFIDEHNEELPSPDFPPSGGYGQEPDYIDEDQAFGPGTCRYGGKVYVSAQQIPRDDPCDFCFCFRSDIICLQQSCPPPIHGCHEEPIQGFCCPRYECPVSMATTLNVTTTTTTTTTTLPPHFLPHAYKGAAQRRGCQIKGHTYKVGEVVRASSGPCLHCTCGGDGQMKCDPKACTPEPMLRQMIAAAVSAKRRR